MPTFGDVFLICGDEHPRFPPSNDYGFAELADLGIKQTDDYFVLCVDGDPAIWIFPRFEARWWNITRGRTTACD